MLMKDIINAFKFIGEAKQGSAENLIKNIGFETYHHLIAMKLYFDNHGRAKLEIGLGRGKKLYDKRETAKERDWNREKSRLLSH